MRCSASFALLRHLSVHYLSPTPPTHPHPTTLLVCMQLRQTLLSISQCQNRKGSGTFTDENKVDRQVEMNFTTNSMICAASKKPGRGELARF